MQENTEQANFLACDDVKIAMRGCLSWAGLVPREDAGVQLSFSTRPVGTIILHCNSIFPTINCFCLKTLRDQSNLKYCEIQLCLILHKQAQGTVGVGSSDIYVTKELTLGTGYVFGPISLNAQLELSELTK